VVIKEAMALVGRSTGPARPPIMPLPPAKRATLQQVVERIEAEGERLVAASR
jgi:dihydrodipicolinate synthase/N-acetylneuraminate lyase